MELGLVKESLIITLAVWQSAANYYADGLQIGETLLLREELKRVKRKSL